MSNNFKSILECVLCPQIWIAYLLYVIWHSYYLNIWRNIYLKNVMYRNHDTRSDCLILKIVMYRNHDTRSDCLILKNVMYRNHDTRSDCLILNAFNIREKVKSRKEKMTEKSAKCQWWNCWKSCQQKICQNVHNSAESQHQQTHTES